MARGQDEGVKLFDMLRRVPVWRESKGAEVRTQLQTGVHRQVAEDREALSRVQHAAAVNIVNEVHTRI